MKYVAILVISLALVLVAQVPIGFGPGTSSIGVLNIFDWYTASPIGCAGPGAKGLCVGPGLYGDSWFFTGWMNNASLLPITTGLPIVGTLNDGSSATCNSNTAVLQLAALDWINLAASWIYDINCMTDYGAGSATNAPAGWNGHCTSGDDGTQICTWKSRGVFVRGGIIYLPVERQPSAGAPTIHDATMVKSSDGGVTWVNPSGASSVNGAAPLCGSAGSGVGQNCLDGSYTASIMWPALPNNSSNWEAIQYGQDGATLPVTNDGCNPSVYTCFMLGDQEGSIARVLNSNLPNLNVSQYQYYTCPTATDVYRCDGSLSSSWTNTFSARTPVVNFQFPYSPPYVMPGSFFALNYLKEFKSYLMSGLIVRAGNTYTSAWLWGPTPFGPWTIVVNNGTLHNTYGTGGFLIGSLAIGYSVVGTNPPHIKITALDDTYTHHSPATPIFEQWDVILGKAPVISSGETPNYSNYHDFSVNAGFTFSAGNVANSFPKLGLWGAWDFYDHGGDTAANISGFHDIGMGYSYMPICPNTLGCYYFNPVQGSNLTTFGASLVNAGYQARFISGMNSPTAMQGNGTFSVGSIFRLDSGSSTATAPIWWTGDASATNSAVGLYVGSFGGAISLAWANLATQFSYQYASTFHPTVSNWYFTCTTVQANGTTPIVHVWVGIGGVLTDIMAGVGRTTTGGSPVATPNVIAGPILMGDDLGANQNIDGSYAGGMIYTRVVASDEVWNMYKTAKVKMAARGVTLQ